MLASTLLNKKASVRALASEDDREDQSTNIVPRKHWFYNFLMERKQKYICGNCKGELNIVQFAGKFYLECPDCGFDRGMTQREQK